MKKYILFTLALALCLTGCRQDKIFQLDEVSALISEKGYGHEEFTQALAGRDREDIVDAWGEPNSMLSGFYGDIWQAGEELIVVVYYDRDSNMVTDVIAGKPDI